MRIVLALLVIAAPALAQAPPHSGQVIHDGFQASDVALFACAVLGVWFARRSMRARARAKRMPAPSVSSDVEKR